MKGVRKLWDEILRLGSPALEKAGGIPPSLRMTARRGEILRLGSPALKTTLTPAAKLPGAPMRGIPPSLRMTAVKGLGILVQIAREIFDENAYARFLQAHGLTHSREAYAHYLEESNLTRERRPRCC